LASKAQAAYVGHPVPFPALAQTFVHKQVRLAQAVLINKKPAPEGAGS
jgi:hypothetical protein